MRLAVTTQYRIESDSCGNIYVVMCCRQRPMHRTPRDKIVCRGATVVVTGVTGQANAVKKTSDDSKRQLFGRIASQNDRPILLQPRSSGQLSYGFVDSYYLTEDKSAETKIAFLIITTTISVNPRQIILSLIRVHSAIMMITIYSVD